jgi:hypothetical protein
VTGELLAIGVLDSAGGGAVLLLGVVEHGVSGGGVTFAGCAAPQPATATDSPQ